MVGINARNKKQIAMVVLGVLLLAGISMTRSFMLDIFAVDLLGIIDLGTLIGIVAAVSLWWMWRREF